MTDKPSICDTSQGVIAAFKKETKDEHLIFSLNFVLEGAVELEDGSFENAELDAAIAHFYNCKNCQDWIEKSDPKIAKARKFIRKQNKRMAKYCCVHMFSAVTDKKPKIKFEFAYFRDEPCWCINKSWEFARFCPWCGTALPPDKSFE